MSPAASPRQKAGRKGFTSIVPPPAPSNPPAPWWRRRLAPPAAAAHPDRDFALEGLRGLCAALVFYAHAFAPGNTLDPAWAPSPRFWWFNLGYAAVMVFFVLSGYVIGLSIRQPASRPEIRRYLSRRVIRLVPVAAAAVLLSWALLPSLARIDVVGNLLFLQNSEPYFGGVKFGLLANNPNLWSLNYEAVYYAGFLLLWRWAPATGLAAGVLIAVVLARAAGAPAPEILVRYACGGLYWLGGLSVAWLAAAPAAGTRKYGNWPCALLGAYALWTLGPLRSVFEQWHASALMLATPAAPHRLDFLPACLWVLLAVTGRAPARQRQLTWMCLGWCSAGFAGYAIAGELVELDWVAAVALAAAWLLRRWQPEPRLLEALAPLGAISFGIYVVTAPIQAAQREVLAGFSGSAFTFAVRLAAIAAVTLGLAWLLESKLYGWLRRRPASARPGGIFLAKPSPELNSRP